MKHIIKDTDRMHEQIGNVLRQADSTDNNLKWRLANYNLASALMKVLILVRRQEQGLEKGCSTEYEQRAEQIIGLLNENKMLKDRIQEVGKQSQNL